MRDLATLAMRYVCDTSPSPGGARMLRCSRLRGYQCLFRPDSDGDGGVRAAVCTSTTAAGPGASRTESTCLAGSESAGGSQESQPCWARCVQF